MMEQVKDLLIILISSSGDSSGNGNCGYFCYYPFQCGNRLYL